MEFILSEKANGSVLKGFMYVSNKNQNDVTYWKCEEHLKCKSFALSTAEEDCLLRAPSKQLFYKELPSSNCSQLVDLFK